RDSDVARNVTHRSQTPHEEEVGDVRHDLALDIQRDEHAGLRRVDDAALLRLAPDRLAKARQLLAGAQVVQKSLAQLARDAHLPQPLALALRAADPPVARVDDPRAGPVRSHASLLARRCGVLSQRGAALLHHLLARRLRRGGLLVDLLADLEEPLDRRDLRLDLCDRLGQRLRLGLQLLGGDVDRLGELARLLTQLLALLQQLCHSLVHCPLLVGYIPRSRRRARAQRRRASCAARVLLRSSIITSCALRKATLVSRYAGSCTIEISYRDAACTTRRILSPSSSSVSRSTQNAIDMPRRSPRLTSSATSRPSVVFGRSSSNARPTSSSSRRNVPDDVRPSRCRVSCA